MDDQIKKRRIGMFYDCETTGLPLFSLPSSHPDQPRIIQLAAALVDLDTQETIASMCQVIRPDGWTIPPKIEQLTGVTNERAEEYGIGIGVALFNFVQKFWRQSSIRIGHNEPFDARMMRIEFLRDNIYSKDVQVGPHEFIPFVDQFKSIPSYCTMIESKTIVNLHPTKNMIGNGIKTPKPPNLSQAYEFFTGKKLEGAHDAMNDVKACIAVYFGIQDHIKNISKRQ